MRAVTYADRSLHTMRNLLKLVEAGDDDANVRVAGYLSDMLERTDESAKDLAALALACGVVVRILEKDADPADIAQLTRAEERMVAAAEAV